MNVMNIYHIISNLGNGGAESMLYRLISNSPINIRHHVISLSGEGKYFKLLEKIGVKVTCLNFKKKRLNIYQIIKLYKILNKEKEIILNTWMSNSNFIVTFLNFFLKKKLIWNIRNSTHPKKQNFLKIIIFKINRYFSNFTDKIIYNSFTGKQFYENTGYSKKNSIVIDNGFDSKIYFLSKELRNNFRNKYFFEKKDFVIGMIARYDPQKNYNLVIDVINKLKDYQEAKRIKFILAGPNIINNNIDLIQKFQSFPNSNVILIGEVTDTNLFYNGVDITILPSSYGEGFPNVIGESMLSGTPCIANKIGDTERIIDKYGWIINDINSNKLINKILNIYNNFFLKEGWSELGLNCNEFISKKYKIKFISEKYFNTICDD